MQKTRKIEKVTGSPNDTDRWLVRNNPTQAKRGRRLEWATHFLGGGSQVKNESETGVSLSADHSSPTNSSVLHVRQILDQPWPVRLPLQCFARPLTRSRHAQRGKVPEHAEVLAGLFCRDGNCRHLQPLTDRLRDVAQGHTFFLHRVICRYTGARLLDRQPIKARHILQWTRSPARGAITHLRRNPFPPRDLNQQRHQPLLARVMHLRQTHNRHMHTLLRHGARRLLRLTRNGRRIERRIRFLAQLARRATRHPDARGNDQQLARLEHRTQRLNRLDLVCAVLRKLRPVVVERQVHYSIHPLRSAAQTVE